MNKNFLHLLGWVLNESIHKWNFIFTPDACLLLRTSARKVDNNILLLARSQQATIDFLKCLEQSKVTIAWESINKNTYKNIWTIELSWRGVNYLFTFDFNSFKYYEDNETIIINNIFGGLGYLSLSDESIIATKLINLLLAPHNNDIVIADLLDISFIINNQDCLNLDTIIKLLITHLDKKNMTTAIYYSPEQLLTKELDWQYIYNHFNDNQYYDNLAFDFEVVANDFNHLIATIIDKIKNS